MHFSRLGIFMFKDILCDGKRNNSVTINLSFAAVFQRHRLRAIAHYLPFYEVKMSSKSVEQLTKMLKLNSRILGTWSSPQRNRVDQSSSSSRLSLSNL